MLTPERILRLLVEIIFVLLGVMLIWLGFTGRIYVDRHKPSWLILGVALILWGLRALYGANRWRARWENWTRGLSLMLLGILMLVMSRAPFLWVEPMLTAAGALLLLRGIIGSALVFRLR